MAEDVEAVSVGTDDGAPYKPFPTFMEWSKSLFDPKLVDSYFEKLEDLKSKHSDTELSTMMAQATKWAAIDTGAIEGLYQVDRGFTFNVAVSSQAWSDIHVSRGEPAARSINDALEAYEYVIDAVTHKSEISEKWIKELHSVICASQDTYTVYTPTGEKQERKLEKGKYKDAPNSPRNLSSGEKHNYASPIDTPIEMHRFIEELRAKEFLNAHPVLQAAYAHYAYVCVHPFPDGNGRVSRALASVYLYRKASLPLVIFSDQSADYLDALELADHDNYQRFIEFISFCVIDTIAFIETRIRLADRPQISQQIESMASALIGRGELQHTEIDLLANRLALEFKNAFENQARKNPLPAPYEINIQQVRGHPSGVTPDDYRVVTLDPVLVNVFVQGGPPINVNLGRQFGVLVARPNLDVPDFLIVSEGRRIQEVYLRQVSPVVKEALRTRLEAEAEGEYQLMLQEVERLGRLQMSRIGYLRP